VGFGVEVACGVRSVIRLLFLVFVEPLFSKVPPFSSLFGMVFTSAFLRGLGYFADLLPPGTLARFAVTNLVTDRVVDQIKGARPFSHFVSRRVPF